VIVYTVAVVTVLLLAAAQAKEKSNDSVAQGHSLVAGQVPDGAASEAHVGSTVLPDNK
jgi:hypothetical protein